MAERLIVDASAAAKLFFEEEHTDKARTLLDDSVFKIAPEIVLAELATPVWRRLRSGVITRDKARQICAEFDDIFASLVPVRSLSRRAAEIMIEFAHPIYDCLYLALAEREKLPLVTAAERLSSVKAVHLADL